MARPIAAGAASASITTLQIIKNLLGSLLKKIKLLLFDSILFFTERASVYAIWAGVVTDVHNIFIAHGPQFELFGNTPSTCSSLLIFNSCFPFVIILYYTLSSVSHLPILTLTASHALMIFPPFSVVFLLTVMV